jgi:hypothetical protein
MDLVAWGAKLAAVYTGILGALAANSAAAANFAEQVLRTSAAFGIATSKYQEQLFAMQALGASADDLADMYSTLSERAVQAQEGSKTYTREFKRMGISIAELKGKKPGELFDLYIQRAGAMTDVTQRAAAAAALLGDDLGRRVAAGLSHAGSSFHDYVRILRAAGGVFPEAALEQAQKAQLQFRLLGATFMVLRRRVGLELAPVFGRFATKVTRLVAENIDVVNEFIDRLKMGVERELLRLELIVTRLDAVVQNRFGGWINLAEGLGVALGGVVAAVTGFKIAAVFSALVPLFTALTVPIAIAAAKIIILAAVIGALGLIFEDLWVDAQGGDSLIGKLIERFRALGGILGDSVAWVLEMVRANFGSLLEEASSLGDELSVAVIPILKFLGNVLLALAGGAFISIVNGLILLGRMFVFLARAITFPLNLAAEFLSILADFPAALMNALGETGQFFKQVASLGGGLLSGLFDDEEKKVTISSNRPSLDNVLRDSLAARGHGSAAAGGTRGSTAPGSGSKTMSQTNEFNTTIQANSKEEGRAAARGFKEGLDREGFYQTLKSDFEPGDL